MPRNSFTLNDFQDFVTATNKDIGEYLRQNYLSLMLPINSLDILFFEENSMEQLKPSFFNICRSNHC